MDTPATSRIKSPSTVVPTPLDGFVLSGPYNLVLVVCLLDTFLQSFYFLSDVK